MFQATSTVLPGLKAAALRLAGYVPGFPVGLRPEERAVDEHAARRYPCDRCGKRGCQPWPWHRKPAPRPAPPAKPAAPPSSRRPTGLGRWRT